MLWKAIILMCTPLAAAGPEQPMDMQIDTLTCEYLVDPIGIDVLEPRLGWQVHSKQRGQKQTAYQIMAADSLEQLAKEQGNLWDTGKITSGQTLHVAYKGNKLSSRQRVYWKVRVWDTHDRPTAYSQPALFEMGLLEPQDWQGAWIAARPDKAQVLGQFDMDQMRWLWYPEPQGQADAETDDAAPLPPTETVRYFRYQFEIPETRQLKRGQILLTVDDKLVLFVNGKRVGEGGNWIMLKHFELTDHLTAGRNTIAIEATDLGQAAGLIGQVRLDFDDGSTQRFSTDGTWKTTDTLTQGWQQRDFDDSGWKQAKVLGKFGIDPWWALHFDPLPEPAPHMRRDFSLAKKIKSARAYISGLGYYELYLNGDKVGDHLLDPAFTDYDKRVLYATYDVTPQLRQGDNAVGIILGTGWYNMHSNAVWNFNRAPWRDVPTARMQLHIVFQDGSTETIVTDDQFVHADGPIRYDCIRNGEYYDARHEIPGWASPSFDDTTWQPVHRVNGPKGKLVAQMAPPIRHTRTVKPVAVKEPTPGTYVFDMGQNLAGHCRINVTGPAGREITLIHGERLNEDGTVQQLQISEHSRQGAFQTDKYTLKGDGREIWEPRFVYHGFQYVQVVGWPGQPTLDQIEARVVHTDCQNIGTFQCSNEVFNQLQGNALWSYVSNFHGYPTDCPHREKNGWTGDAHLAAEQAMFNFNNVPAYAKWVADCSDAMRESGELPGIVPTGGWGYGWGNGPAWDIAYLLIPWYMYEYVGDTRLLAEHYDKHKRYVDYLEKRSENLIIPFGLGDWVPLDQETPNELTSTAYFYLAATIVARSAELLGHDSDHAHYRDLAKRIKEAFNTTFLDKDTGRYSAGTQTAQCCPLFMDMVPPEQTDAVLAHLVANIAEENDHINTGVLGSKYLLHALSDHGQAELAYKVAAQTTFPGWGYWIAQGANTLWEDWRGVASLNHIFFGDICAWFYKSLAGIRPDPAQPGFKNIIFKPHPVADLIWAKAEYNSIRGKIVSDWKIADGRFEWTIVVPTNSTATVFLPSTDRDSIREANRPLDENPYIELVTSDEEHTIVQIQSGQYHFTCPRGR